MGGHSHSSGELPRRAGCFLFLVLVGVYITCMYKYCICLLISILQDSLMASAERLEDKPGWGGWRFIQTVYIAEKPSAGEEEGAVPEFVHREEHFVSDQPIRLMKRDSDGRRESRGRTGWSGVSVPSRSESWWIFFRKSAGFCLLAGFFKVLLPSSLPG